MTSRPAAHIVLRIPADQGEHPNKYAGGITVDFRVFWPANATVAEIDDAIAKGVFELNKDLGAKYGK